MLITENYRALNATMHRTMPQYGARGDRSVPNILDLMERRGGNTILDYGCGKGMLMEALRARTDASVAGYDPAIPEYAAPPEPADIVACLDVLEHVEPECLDDVIADLHRLTKRALYVDICAIPALKTLPDGRNAHLIVQPFEWWLPKFDAFEYLGSRIEERRRHMTLVFAP